MDNIFLLAILLLSFFCGLLVGSCAKRRDDDAAIAAAIRQGEQNGQRLSLKKTEVLESNIRVLRAALIKKALEFPEKGYDRI